MKKAMKTGNNFPVESGNQQPVFPKRSNHINECVGDISSSHWRYFIFYTSSP